jgi:hypothetical protein
MMTTNPVPPSLLRSSGSFRDPSGVVYLTEDRVLRTIQPVFAEHWNFAETSGFFAEAVRQGKLLPFAEIAPLKGSWKTLEAERLPFVSYPYEWSFGQLKDAALLTLDLMQLAMKHGLVLKDASAYNIQFHQGKPVFIDHLSFEIRRVKEPWGAYLQFCKHFLAPLSLMCHRDVRCGKMLSLWVDGLPLDMVSSLLPWKTRFSPLLQLHIHTHAKMQQRHADARVAAGKIKRVTLNENTVPRLCESLRMAIEDMRLPALKTEWGDYYDDTNYSPEGAEEKARLVRQIAASRPGALALDLGANTGVYSRILAEHFKAVVASDIDYLAVEKMYAALKQEKNRVILPLVLDLSNPSPGIGWDSEERESFRDRGKAELLSALALIHHLVHGAGIPLDKVAHCFAALLEEGGTLILEFGPWEDSQVQRLMAARQNVFPDYTLEGCVAAFRKEHFILQEQFSLADSLRTLLVFTRK